MADDGRRWSETALLWAPCGHRVGTADTHTRQGYRDSRTRQERSGHSGGVRPAGLGAVWETPRLSLACCAELQEVGPAPLRTVSGRASRCLRRRDVLGRSDIRDARSPGAPIQRPESAGTQGRFTPRPSVSAPAGRRKGAARPYGMGLRPPLPPTRCSQEGPVVRSGQECSTGFGAGSCSTATSAVGAASGCPPWPARRPRRPLAGGLERRAGVLMLAAIAQAAGTHNRRLTTGDAKGIPFPGDRLPQLVLLSCSRVSQPAVGALSTVRLAFPAEAVVVDRRLGGCVPEAAKRASSTTW